MILTVTLNAALDVTYHVDALRPGQTHRPHAVDVRAGGKGINVARVLTILGEPVSATGLAGGATGELLVRRLERDGVPARFTGVAAESRRTVVIADPVAATGIWEPGPTVTPAEWARFLALYAELLAGARLVVLSGSLPPGLPVDAYAHLVEAARAAGIAALLDADGPALLAGLAARPALVKPNATELGEAVNATIETSEQALRAAHKLRAGSATTVVASLGPHGLVAATPEHDLVATPPEPVTGNPTGAGDAAVAALARGLLRSKGWPATLADAVSISAAAVAAPVAGQFDPDTASRIRDGVTVIRRPHQLT